MSRHFQLKDIESTDMIDITPKNTTHIPQKWRNNEFCKRKKRYPPEKLDRIYEFNVREDDTWIITNPRCGTTWTQEMVWLLLNNLNYDKARNVNLEERSPYLEFPACDNIEFCDKLASPRVIKTHLPIQILPKDIWTKKPKMVYVSRDPRDAFVSSYNQELTFRKIYDVPDKNQFFRNLVKYSGYWEHVLPFFEQRNRENILFISYEQLKSDLKAMVLKVCDFLGKSYEEKDINSLVEHLSFRNMKGF
ncbi:hypothetical protein ACFFRR_004798 [Megaselia abdita]